MQRSTYRFTMVAALLVLIISLMLPIQPALAALSVSQTVTLSNDDFDAGIFGLTSLIQEDTDTGGVQLVPLGTLKLWQDVPTEGTLCRPITNMAVATFKTHIYMFGGLTREPGAPNDSITREVCRTQILDKAASKTAWVSNISEDLPESRSSAAAVSVPYPGDPNRGVIYVAGGLNASSQSMDTIWSTVVNSDGSLGAWRTEPAFPPPDGFRSSIGMIAYTSRVNNKSYVYVMGGVDRTFVPLYHRSVLRAEVQADGRLGSWVTLNPMPVPTLGLQPACLDLIGVAGHSVVSFDALSADGASTPMIAVMGGIAGIDGEATASCPRTVQATANTYLAEINEDTGDLTWQADQYTLPQPLSQLGAIALNQKIYTSGGAIGADQAQVTNLVMSSYANLEKKLPQLGKANFLQSTTALNPVWARAGHGLVYIDIDNRPIAFMFGGKDNNGNYRSDTLYGFIGLEDDIDSENAGYANPGLYQSPVYEFRGPAQVTKLEWQASVANATFTTDIEMQYRLGSTPQAIRSATWIEVDADPNSPRFSVDGMNTGVVTATEQGLYFQYRALLRTSEPSNRDATPVLRGPIKVFYTVDGYPNVMVVEASMPVIEAGVEVEPTVILGNQKPITATETLLDADLESEGTFFVDMYVFAPGQPVTIPQPNADGTYPLTSAAYAEVNRAQLPADSSFPVSPGSWHFNCGPIGGCPPVNWRVIFNQVGTWNVVLVVDTGNNVTEADAPTIDWEADNNVYQFQVVSNFDGGQTYLPILRQIVRTPPTSMR